MAAPRRPTPRVVVFGSDTSSSFLLAAGVLRVGEREADDREKKRRQHSQAGDREPAAHRGTATANKKKQQNKQKDAHGGWRMAACHHMARGLILPGPCVVVFEGGVPSYVPCS